MRVITVITNNYIVFGLRLFYSLKRYNKEVSFVIYLEDKTYEELCKRLGCRTKILSEIKSLGVKRAKFVAYLDAITEGSFAHLDADIIVLGDLTELQNEHYFVACRDDMSECSFILDKSKPWPNKPGLTGERYFNSGVFFAPASLKWFFERCYKDALNDKEWNSLIIPDKLFDNHFLCAKVAEYNIPIRWISEYEYNWQGFRKESRILVKPDNEGKLINVNTGRPLKLVHFAGIQDIDRFIIRLPEGIVRILSIASSGIPAGVLEFINSAIWQENNIEEHIKLKLLASSISKKAIITEGPVIAVGHERPYVDDAQSLHSIATSTISDTFKWNGLECGGAYLSANEYYELRKFIIRKHIKSIFESGVGYTSVLFKKIVKKTTSVDGWQGPWFDFALNNGCNAFLVPFNALRGGYDYAKLKEIIYSNNNPEFVFIDSPQGTENRRLIVNQLIELLPKANYYAFHDAKRDASIVYQCMQRLNLSVVEYIDSLRGLIILGKSKSLPSLFQNTDKNNKTINPVDVRGINFLVHIISAINMNNSISLTVALKNSGAVTIPFTDDPKLFFSYHTGDKRYNIIKWDNYRYELPCDLDPEDKVQFDIRLPLNLEKERIIYFDLVKEGEFWWSQLTGKECPKWFV